MVQKRLMAGVTALVAAALIAGPAVAANAVTVYTGSRYCAPLNTAQTVGYVQPNNTIKHYQLIGSTWWASPTLFREAPGALRTTWWYQYGNRSFSNSYITTSITAATGTSTSCFS